METLTSSSTFHTSFFAVHGIVMEQPSLQKKTLISQPLSPPTQWKLPNHLLPKLRLLLLHLQPNHQLRHLHSMMTDFWKLFLLLLLQLRLAHPHLHLHLLHLLPLLLLLLMQVHMPRRHHTTVVPMTMITLIHHHLLVLELAPAIHLLRHPQG